MRVIWKKSQSRTTSFWGSRIVEKFRKYLKRNFGKLKNEKIVDDLDFEINFGAYQYDTKVGPTSFGSF